MSFQWDWSTLPYDTVWHDRVLATIEEAIRAHVNTKSAAHTIDDTVRVHALQLHVGHHVGR